MKKNNSGFSILFAMGYIIILSLIVIVLIEYLLPFSKNIKGMENSSNAYYQSLSGIEQALYEKKSLDVGGEKSDVSSGTKIKYSYDISASGSILPPVGKGNSDYDKDWNKLGFGEPIQLKFIKKDIDWSKVKFYFRVPDLDRDGTNDEELFKSTNTGANLIINAQYSGSGYVLNANTDSMITVDNINIDGSNGNTGMDFSSSKGILIGSKIEKQVDSVSGEILPPPILGFKDFNDGSDVYPDNYNSNTVFLTPCKDTTCTLKMSVINKLIVEKNGIKQEIPYLEYKIDFNGTTVPTRFSRISSDGFSNGFKKTINIEIPQYTTNQAFDFAVFQ